MTKQQYLSEHCTSDCSSNCRHEDKWARDNKTSLNTSIIKGGDNKNTKPIAEKKRYHGDTCNCQSCCDIRGAGIKAVNEILGATKPIAKPNGWEEATKNALPEMKWRSDLMIMIYEVAITKQMLGSDLIDKIVEHERQAILSAEKKERQRIVSSLFKEGRNYVVWLKGDKLSVVDTDNISLPDQDQSLNTKTE